MKKHCFDCGKDLTTPSRCPNALCSHDVYEVVQTIPEMNKYSVTIKKTSTAKLVLTYDEGLLINIEIPPSQGLTAEQISWLKTTMPAAERDLDNLRVYPFISMESIAPDLSFNAFWEAYDYKVGKKERAIKLWLALNEADRNKAMRSIPRYKQWLALRPSMERLYPETFLNQRRFDNEFKV